MYEKWIDVLSACRLFEGINGEQLLNTLGCLDPSVSTYKRNEYIKIAGDDFEGQGIVLSGSVSVNKENAAGNRIMIYLFGPGENFGEMAAFSGSGVWPATVVAQEDCEIMFLNSERIVGSCSNACKSHHQIIMNMLKIISNKALRLNRKVEYLSIKSIRGKISTFLLEEYNRQGNMTFMLSMNRNDLAEFLNVSRPSLSREMGGMRDEGIIDFHRSSIRILDLNRLSLLAE